MAKNEALLRVVSGLCWLGLILLICAYWVHVRITQDMELQEAEMRIKQAERKKDLVMRELKARGVDTGYLLEEFSQIDREEKQRARLLSAGKSPEDVQRAIDLTRELMKGVK